MLSFRSIFSFQYLVAVISKKKEYRFVPKNLNAKAAKFYAKGAKLERTACSFQYSAAVFRKRRIGNAKKESTDYKSALSGFYMFLHTPAPL